MSDYGEAVTVVIVGLGQLGSDVAARLVARGEDVIGIRRTAPPEAAALPEPTPLPQPTPLPEPSPLPEPTPLPADTPLPEPVPLTQPTPLPEPVEGHLTLQLLDIATDIPSFPADTTAVVISLAPRARSVEAYDVLYRDGIANVLAAVAALPGRAPRIVFVSSTAVWSEDAGEHLDDTSPARPATGTARALLAAEDAVRAAVAEACCVRFGGLYGPSSTMLLDQVRAGHVTRPSGWTNRIHRDDAAAVVLHLLDLPAVSLLPVVAGIDEEPALLSEVVDHLAEQLGVAPPQLDEAGRTPEERRRGKRIAASALRGTGFAYRYPTFREGYCATLTS